MQPVAGFPEFSCSQRVFSHFRSLTVSLLLFHAESLWHLSGAKFPPCYIFGGRGFCPVMPIFIREWGGGGKCPSGLMCYTQFAVRAAISVTDDWLFAVFVPLMQCLKVPLTHICLLPYHRTSPFPILGVSGVLFHFKYLLVDIPVSKQWRPWSDRCRVLWRLIWVCSGCLCPKNGTLGLYGLKLITSAARSMHVPCVLSLPNWVGS